MALITEKTVLCDLVKEMKYGKNIEIIHSHKAAGRIIAEDLFAEFTMPLKSIKNSILQETEKDDNNIIPMKKYQMPKYPEEKSSNRKTKDDIIDIEKYFPKADLFSTGDLLFPKGMELSEEDLPLLEIAKIEKVKVRALSTITHVTSGTEDNSNSNILKIIAGKLGKKAE